MHRYLKALAHAPQLPVVLGVAYQLLSALTLPFFFFFSQDTEIKSDSQGSQKVAEEPGVFASSEAIVETQVRDTLCPGLRDGDGPGDTCDADWGFGVRITPEFCHLLQKGPT